MIRDREHLPLPVATGPLERRKRPAPAKPRGDKRSHGDELLQDVTEVETGLRQRQAVPLDGLNPANIFKVSIETGRSLDEDVLRKLKLVLLAAEPDKAFMVSTEDVTVSEMRQRLSSYRSEGEDGPKYSELSAISSISLIDAKDRIGPRLMAHPVEEGMIEALDVELWHWGNKAQCFERIHELGKALENPEMGVPDRWVGEGICLARIKTDAATLRKLLEWPAIRVIERRATPTLSMADHWHLSANEVVPEPLPKDAVGILVIDSGVASLHPLLAPIVGDAQAFPEAFLEKIGGSAADEHGHGTAVAVIAAYGDVAEAVRQKRFLPTARIFSARVLDKDCHYDEDSLIESQLAAAVEYFLREYPIIKVVNLSLGSSDDILSDSRYQMRFAAVVDELAYQFRDQEVVFVIASGNLGRPPSGAGENEINSYPQALLSHQARLTDPASAALALTVGGLSAGRIDNHDTEARVARLVGQRAGNPSPFTRTGPGHERAIKPELVAEGGDYLVGATGIIRDAGVLSANHKMDSGQLFKQWVGTSFACPFVANLAARLSTEYPDFSSNMIRAMLVHSAQLPSELHEDFAKQKHHAQDLLRVYGYGKPDWQRARLSAKNDVLLLRDETIGLDTFQIFELPALPEAFVTTKGKRRIEITLAYDPPTRASRADNYLGVKLEFALWKNVDLEGLRDAYRKWDREEKAELDEDANPPGLGDVEGGQIVLQPKATRRQTSTVQHAWIDISKPGNLTSEQPLYLVLVCQRNWAPSEIERQRFAVIMSLSHENTDVDLQASIRLQPKIRAELRLRADQLRLRLGSI
jgi:hypothetical protein